MRQHSDNYPTPPAVVHKMLETAQFATQHFPVARVLEPGCGARAPFISGRFPFFPNSEGYGVEIQRRYPSWIRDPNIVFSTDFLTWQPVGGMKFDLIITNPPFSVAQKFLMRSRLLLTEQGKIVFLLRLGWLAGQGRYHKLHSVWPPEQVYVLPKRPSFTTNGKTDMTEYGIFVYGRRETNEMGLTTLHWRY